jgi:hypothetical protein
LTPGNTTLDGMKTKLKNKAKEFVENQIQKRLLND